MRRPISAIAITLGTLGMLGATLAAPVAAQAATTSRPAVHAVIPRLVRYASFTGKTYPDTATGLADCQAEGKLEEEYSYGSIVNYSCPLNDPDAGVYNLWVYYQFG